MQPTELENTSQSLNVTHANPLTQYTNQLSKTIFTKANAADLAYTRCMQQGDCKTFDEAHTEVKAISGNVKKLLGDDEQVPTLAGIFCPHVSAQSDRR
jgi:hypothetical protein